MTTQDGAARCLAGVEDTSTNKQLAIRPFAADDAAAVKALFVIVNRQLAPSEMEGLFEDYIARSVAEEISDIDRYYASHGGGFWVAHIADDLVGMFGLERVDENTAELRRMYVDPLFRQRGIGRTLLLNAERLALTLGATRLVLSTSEIQAAALALYRKAGYEQVYEEIATSASVRTVGGAIRRFHFEKSLGCRRTD